MNEAESTQSLSGKVVDRANVLRFAAPRTIAAAAAERTVAAPAALSRRRWQARSRDVGTIGADLGHVERRLETIVEPMRRLCRPIGHRLGRAILAHVAIRPEDGRTRNRDIPIADQIELRLPPKLRGAEIDAAQGDPDCLRRHAGEEPGDTGPAEAILAEPGALRQDRC